eukprot:TRINITY_DN5209_c0_g1_i4.p1 TRINITY_DN5209_c0_g1~~TRINITY_DN5209_c0_g1_i4.p1  ORF type:complete len:632 (+),score=132.79 TRINITY_DN5209_c0_g1_i4:185-2080(+)
MQKSSLLLVVLVGTFFSFTESKVIYVQTWGSSTTGDGSISNPFLTWKTALENATSGDTVQFGPGRFNISTDPTYYTDRFKNFTIAGNPGTNKTFIDGGIVFGYTVTQWWPRHCENVYLTNLHFNTVKIRALNSSRITISSCSFTNCGDTDGAFYGSMGTVVDPSSTLTIDNTLFRNSAFYSVFSDGYYAINIFNSKFMNNSNSYNYQSFKTLKTLSLNMTGTLFWKSTGMIVSFQTTGASLTMTNNNFYNTFNPTPSITCEMPGVTPVFASKNLFCGDAITGELNNIQGCGTWPELYYQSPADTCGICLGTNANIDCNGNCWSDPLPSCSARNTYYVSPSGSDSNSGTSSGSAKLTIKAAVALMSYGDTVVLDRGNYTGSGNENIDLPKGTTLKGCADCLPDDVVVGYTTKDIFWLNSSDVSTVISGITIANTTRSGVLLQALYPTGITVKDSIFRGNQISVSSYGLSNIDNCIFRDNVVQFASVTTVVYNRFYSTSTYSGGRVSNSKFKGNIGNKGGALFTGVGTTAILTNVDFVGNRQNSVGVSGGAINVANNAAVWLTRSTFSGNSIATINDGQDLACVGTGSQVVSDNVLFCHNVTTGPVIGCNAFTPVIVPSFDAVSYTHLTLPTT